MGASKQFKIVIGADAKQFNDTMKGVKQDMRGVGTESVAMGLGVSGAIHDVSNAIQNFFRDAVAAAQTLPEGVNAAVDAFKELDKQIEITNKTIGANLIASGSNWQLFKLEFYTWMAGATSASSTFGDVFASFFGGATGMAANAKLLAQGAADSANLAANIETVTKAEQAREDRLKRMMERGKEWLKQREQEAKVQARIAEDAAKQAEAARQAAAYAAWDLAGKEQVAFNTGRDVGPMMTEDELNGMRDAYREAFDPILLIDFDGNLQKINETLTRQQEIASFVGTAFNHMFLTALNSGADFFEQMQLWLENFIKRMAAAAATALLLSAISGGVSTGFLAAFKGLIGFTKMAHGGIVDKPTNVQVGEAGPEAIIPLHKLSSLTGGGNLTARISGRDLLILLDREQNFKKRVYG